MKRTIDFGYRAFFGWYLLYAPYAALTNRTSQPAIFALIEGPGGWAVLAALALVGGAIWADIVCNGLSSRFAHRISWVWIRPRRDLLYLIGAALAIAVPFSLSRFDLVEASAIWWYGGLSAWGLHLAYIDIDAKTWGHHRVYRK